MLLLTCTSHISMQQNSSLLFFVLLQGVYVCMNYISQSSNLDGLFARFVNHSPLHRTQLIFVIVVTFWWTEYSLALWQLTVRCYVANMWILTLITIVAALPLVWFPFRSFLNFKGFYSLILLSPDFILVVLICRNDNSINYIFNLKLLVIIFI